MVKPGDVIEIVNPSHKLFGYRLPVAKFPDGQCRTGTVCFVWDYEYHFCVVGDYIVVEYFDFKDTAETEENVDAFLKGQLNDNLRRIFG